MADVFNGELQESSGGGGGGRGDIYVDSLPDAATAREDVTYVRRGDGTQWYIGSEPVAAVAGSIGKTLISPSNHEWEGSQDSDPTDGSLVVAAAYWKSDTGVFRTKPAGSVDGILNSADLTPATGITWLDSADTDPSNDARAAYYKTDTSTFRIKAVGSVDSSITAADATLHTSDTFGSLSPQATDPTVALVSPMTSQVYYNTTNNVWRFRSASEDGGAWRDANTNNVRFGLVASTLTAANWIGTGADGLNVSGTQNVNTVAEAVAYFGGLTSPFNFGTRTFFFDSVAGTVKEITAFTEGVEWEDSDIVEITGDLNALFIGTGGIAGTVGLDTVAEVIAYLDTNPPDDTKSYHFYNATADSLRDITSFEASVAWVDAVLSDIITGRTSFLGLGGLLGTGDINTDAEVLTYLDSDYDSLVEYYFNDGSDVQHVSAYTATVPAHDRPIWEALGGGGGGGASLTNAEVEGIVEDNLNVEFVDSLPDAADADSNKVYVLNSDFSEWVRKATNIPQTITHVAFTGYFASYNNRGVHNQDSDVSSPSQNDIFFSLSRNSFRLRNNVNAWVDRSIAQVTSSTHTGIGIGNSTPIPIVTDTVAEVAAYFNANGFTGSTTYLIYLASLGEIREATAYIVASVEYEMIQVRTPGNAYYDYTQRTVVVPADRDTAAKIALNGHTTTVYGLIIEQDSDLPHLVDVGIGTAVRLSEGNTLWMGRVQSFTVIGGVYEFRTNFHTRRGTFPEDRKAKVEFGAYPQERGSLFFGENQTVRINFDPGPNTQVDNRSADYDIEANGIKPLTGSADENKNGGIRYSFFNLNDDTDVDSAAQVDVANTGIEIGETGIFNVKIHFDGSQPSDGDVTLKLLKLSSGTDDALVVASPGWRTGFENVVQYDTVEEYVPITAGDKFYLRLFNVEDFVSDLRYGRLIGYLQITRT